LGDPAAAKRSCRQAYALLLLVSPQNPPRTTTVSGATGTTTSGVRVHTSSDLDILSRFFRVLNDLGTAHVQAGEPGLGLMKYYEALYIQQNLVRNNPRHARIVSFKHGLANQWSTLGTLQGDLGLIVEALAYHKEAQTILRGLVRDYPRHAGLADV